MAVLDPVKLELDQLGRGVRQRRAPRSLPCAGASAAARARQAPLRARPRGLDRARRLRRGAAEGLLPAVPRQQGAPEVRLRRRVHRLREGRGRQRHARCWRTCVPDTKSGTPGADAVKVKGTITWVGAHDAVPAEVRLYDRLFTEAQPDAGGKDFLSVLNPHSKKRRARLSRAVARARRRPTTALPVRAPRLLRRRSRRPRGRATGVQQDRRPEGQLGEITSRRRSAVQCFTELYEPLALQR